MKLKDDVTNIRKEAAHALGQIGDIRAVDSLITSLNDENEDVRYAAVEAPGFMKDKNNYDYARHKR